MKIDLIKLTYDDLIKLTADLSNLPIGIIKVTFDVINLIFDLIKLTFDIVNLNFDLIKLSFGIHKTPDRCSEDGAEEGG